MLHESAVTSLYIMGPRLAVLHIPTVDLLRFTSQAKWDKAKHHIQWMQDHLRQDLGMDRDTFKSCQGFLVHMGGTYEVIKPYLHALFLAENAWRDNHDSQGY